MLLALLFFSVRFLISAFNENGAERLIPVIFLIFIILFTLAHFVGTFLGKFKTAIYSRLSQKNKSILQTLGKISDYVAVLALGAMIYIAWTHDAFLALFFLLFLGIDLITHITKESQKPAT